MLYMIVMCAGGLCMPVESVGAYTLTLADCRERVAQMERVTHNAGLDCYSDEDFDLDVIRTGLMLGADKERPIMIAPSHH